MILRDPVIRHSPHDSIRSLAMAALLMTAGTASVPGRQTAVDDAFLTPLKFRLLGPFRGGRVSGVSGVVGDPHVYYFGAVAGGVWKTTDGGTTWAPIFEDQPIASIGALAVFHADPDIIYVGTGEACIRSDGSHGNGVYKSTDAGKSWKHVGLTDTRYIGDVIVDPLDPDVVFVAALGQADGFEGNKERGVFRSKDGGNTWAQVLYVNRKTGAVDLTLDPRNPATIIAATWDVHRGPWELSSGGAGSGLYRSTDAGDTWKRLTEGLPKGIMGRIGVDISPADPNRVYAVIEASEEERGMYRSDDGGKSWQQVSSDHDLVQRPWYYMHVTADPRNRDVVYVPSLSLIKSVDGGRTWKRMPQYHPDNHSLWIDPTNPQRMINGNDGGANISVNGGQSWTRSEDNQPTGAIYHVTTDNQFPYRVYGSMQDFRSIAIKSLGDAGFIESSDMEVIGGCQGGFILPYDPDPNIVYHSCTQGWLMRHDSRTGLVQRIDPWPDSNIGLGADVAKYRFHWTAPLVGSPHDPEVVYFAGNVIFKSTNGGRSWELISPDLSRNDKNKQRPSGGPLTRDSIGIEYYNLVFAMAESPRQKGLMWAGTDDGLIQVTRDGGKTWTNVTPREMPEWSRISGVDPSPHDAGTLYVAVDRHQLNDFRPYIYRTTDYGATWTRINNGIPTDTYVRAVREDPGRRGLLYAGTERGVYVSFDAGSSWQSLQLNMPVAPVHDLVAKGSDLVIGTHGRGIWVLDDLSPLRELNPTVMTAAVHLFKPVVTYRMRTDEPYFSMAPPAGQNPPLGAVFHYSFAARPSGEVRLAIRNSGGQVIRTFSSARTEGAESSSREALATEPGLNRFVWDMRYPGPRKVPDAFLFDSLLGPTVLPGSYQVALTVASQTLTVPFEIKADPRITATLEDLTNQLTLHLEIRDSLSTMADVTNRIRDVRRQLTALQEKAKQALHGERVVYAANAIAAKITTIEAVLTQRQARTFGDTFNYGVKVDGKLASLMDVVGDGRPGLFNGAAAGPTRQSYEVHKLLWGIVEKEMNKLNAVLMNDVPALSKLAVQVGLGKIESGEEIRRATGGRPE